MIPHYNFDLHFCKISGGEIFPLIFFFLSSVSKTDLSEWPLDCLPCFESLSRTYLRIFVEDNCFLPLSSWLLNMKTPVKRCFQFMCHVGFFVFLVV